METDADKCVLNSRAEGQERCYREFFGSDCIQQCTQTGEPARGATRHSFFLMKRRGWRVPRMWISISCGRPWGRLRKPVVSPGRKIASGFFLASWSLQHHNSLILLSNPWREEAAARLWVHCGCCAHRRVLIPTSRPLGLAYASLAHADLPD